MNTRNALLAVVLILLAAAPCAAASVPAWLDDAISGWNTKNSDKQIQFVSIKDSYAWYKMQATPEVGQKDIRDRCDKLVKANGYADANDEETVTTGRPPSNTGNRGDKKCWKRSFVLDLQAQANTTAVDGDHAGTRQRMLTRMVCQDGDAWMTGFRIAE